MTTAQFENLMNELRVIRRLLSHLADVPDGKVPREPHVYIDGKEVFQAIRKQTRQ